MPLFKIGKGKGKDKKKPAEGKPRGGLREALFGKARKGRVKGAEIDITVELLSGLGFVTFRPLRPEYKILESYYVYEPFAKVTIAMTPEGPMYFVTEVELEPEEYPIIGKLIEILFHEIRTTELPQDIRKFVFEELGRIMERYRAKFGIVGVRRYKILYYMERNLLGFGPIDPLMRDPHIEDISCDGVGKPIYVWHRKYESIPTNIIINDINYLNALIMKFAHMAGKHVSTAYPVVDAMLPGKHRFAATFGTEVSPKGPTFTIRKFREKPFSVTELIRYGTIDSLTAAYLWTLIEHGRTIMIAGGTGAGKSFPGNTLLIVRINNIPKIISVKDLYELVNTNEYNVDDHLVKDVDKLNIEVLSIDSSNYKLKWKRVLRIIKHKDQRPLIKVRTNSSIIITTQDHNFVKIDSETLDLKSVKASELRVGDHLVNVWLDINYGQTAKIEPEYAYLLGLWAGDGSVDTTTGAIYFSNSDVEIINRYKSLVRKYWKVKTKEHRDKRNDVINVIFSNDNVLKYLKSLFERRKARNITVPPEILFSNELEVPIAFLAGLFDSDGSIHYISRQGRSRIVVEFGSRSLKLVNGVSLILKRLRIMHHMKIRYVKGNPYYKILVYDSSALELLNKIQRYSIKVMRSKPLIEAIHYNVSNPNINVFPIDKYLRLIKEELGIGQKSIEKEMNLSSRYLRRYEHDRRSISLENLRKFYEYYLSKVNGNEKALKMLERLRKLIEGDLLIEKVIELTKVNPTDEYLYDLEVEDTHVFVIGQVGWRLNHNTTLLNVLSLFIKPGMKIVTVEDIPELNLPHENWVQLISRPSYIVGAKTGEVSLFDLVKLSLRYRPDYLIVGEVRGEEAYVLFQALASVSYDTPILIKDKEGNIRLIKIGEFVDKFYREGEERVAKFVEGYYVLSNDGFNITWKPIKYVLRHSTDEVYEIEYEGGGKIEATGSHSVFVLNTNDLRISEKPVIELHEGDLLLSFNNKENSEGNKEYKTIDVIELVRDGSDEVYVDGLPEDLRKYTKGKNPIPLQQYVELRGSTNAPSIRNDFLTIRVRRSKYVLPTKLVLDEELAFLFGVYIANGCIKYHRGKRICFTFGVNEGDIAERVIKIMYDKFNVKPVIDERDTRTIYEYPHTLLATVFEKLLGDKLANKRIPSILWNSPRNVVRSFLEGLKADTRRTLKRGYTRYTTSNKELAYQLLWLARYAGFYSELVIENDSGKNTGKKYYNVLIYLDEKYKRPNASEKIPIELLLKLIEYARPKLMPLELTYISKRKFVSKKVALKVIEWIKKKGKLNDFSLSYLRKLEALINSDIVIVKVKKIRKKPYRGYVYDISVPKTESFFGGPVPILLHNTGHGGLSTIHAETLDYAIKRLTSPPMNIPPAYMKLMNAFIHIQRIQTRVKRGVVRVRRRITTVQEVRDYNDYIEVVAWDPRDDLFKVDLNRSYLLDDIASRTGLTKDEVIDKVMMKKVFLDWLVRKEILDVWEVSKHIFNFYLSPDTAYRRAVRELKELGGGEIES